MLIPRVSNPAKLRAKPPPVPGHFNLNEAHSKSDAATGHFTAFRASFSQFEIAAASRINVVNLLFHPSVPCVEAIAAVVPKFSSSKRVSDRSHDPTDQAILKSLRKTPNKPLM